MRPRRDLIVSPSPWYTQSNSVCYAKDGQAIGVGPGSSPGPLHSAWRATRRTTGSLRQNPVVLSLAPSGLASAAPTGTTPSTSPSPMSTWTTGRDGIWENTFTENRYVFTKEERPPGSPSSPAFP